MLTDDDHDESAEVVAKALSAQVTQQGSVGAKKDASGIFLFTVYP